MHSVLYQKIVFSQSATMYVFHPSESIFLSCSAVYMPLLLDVLGTCLGLSLLSIHTARRLYQSIYVSIFSRHRTLSPLGLASLWSFHLAAGLSAVAGCPDLVRPVIGQCQSTWCDRSRNVLHSRFDRNRA